VSVIPSNRVEDIACDTAMTRAHRTARCWGGNLTLISTCWGRPTSLDRGGILYVEDSNEQP
jgi:muramoyltetrapeptide carboxypeptidase LdcA involved in peptidoglycan recycling